MKKQISNLSVLIVDDSQHVRKQLSDVLKTLEFTKIDFAGDGLEGLEKIVQARKNKQPYGIIFSDLQMPKMTGLQLLDKLRQEQNDKTPFIVLTSETSRQNILGAIKNGANNYIIKPATKKVLEEKINVVFASEEDKMKIDDGSTVVDQHVQIEDRVSLATNVINYDYNLLNSIFSSTSDLIAVIDPEGIVIRVNPAMCEMIGLTKGEIIGMSALSFINSDRDENLLDKILSSNLHEHRSFLVSISKKHIPVLISSSVYLNDKGEVKGRIVTAKNFEKEYELQNQLTYTAKMVGIGEMANGVAHEINNPLTVILGKAKIIKREIESGNMDSDKVLTSIVKIQETSMNISEILKALMIFSSSSSATVESEGPPKLESIGKIISQTLSLCRNRFLQNDVKIEVAEIPESIKAVCCPGQISQVMLNMLSNSYYFLQELSYRWVKVDVIEYDKKVEILITDSGEGISEELHEKVFTPFYTTRPIGKGVGLGLSVAKGIIGQHDGDIRIDKQCKNTRFIISLPKEIKIL